MRSPRGFRPEDGESDERRSSSHVAVNAGVGYSADIETARDMLRKFSRAHASVTQVVGCPVVALASSSVTLRLRAWCADSAPAKTLEYGAYEYAQRSFDEAGIEIEIPYP